MVRVSASSSMHVEHPVRDLSPAVDFEQRKQIVPDVAEDRLILVRCRFRVIDPTGSRTVDLVLDELRDGVLLPDSCR